MSHLSSLLYCTIYVVLSVNRFQVTFDEFKEGFVAVLSQAIEQLSSSEDEDQPSDSTAGKLVSSYTSLGNQSRLFS